ncbi:hypothetical protein K461DRAFT_311491 [Myriangium duriaei CBS 260.36]|uniref:F-box domain-containing protein n=1 Tax=Myriangium duriaei CBS 260.36 TaxID=1168546 RepID=A0A9P4J509_9PEZI|nr:hypothetical protein K461DRAFT_311491 [Myriangium duriaei CBS 260.36]
MTTTTVTSRDQRRRSSTSWMKLPKLALRGAKRSAGGVLDDKLENATPCKLLELPSELLINVLSNLDLDDLFALRRTNRALNEIITTSGSDVARYWASYKLEQIPRLLGQVPIDGQHWQHVLRQTRRWNNASNSAEVIKTYIQYKTLLYHNAQRNIRFAPVAKRIRERMTPSLFLISAYLSHIKALILDLASSDDLSVECQAHVDAHTIAMLEGIPVCDLRTLHYMWLFLLWLLNTLISRPTYAGTIERTVRGWTADPLDRCSLARILVFGNLPAIKKLLQLRDYNERRKWALNFLKSLEPEGTVKWAEHWAKLDVGLNDAPTAAQARKGIRMDIHMHCLWTQGAQLVFEKAGDEYALEEDEKKPSANNTVRLLADLAGYDLFHATVPPDYDDESSRQSSLREVDLERSRTLSVDATSVAE